MEDLTIEELSSAIKKGIITAQEVVAQCIANHNRNAHLNAFTLFLGSKATKRAAEIDGKIKRGEKTGRLAGIPFSVKDNIFTKGIATTAASDALRGFVPEVNSPVVQHLLDEDAILIGKTNMHELAFGITSLNGSYGFVKNPHNPSKIAGGSSGGAAASVAVLSSVFGLGTDTGGSTRIPPALTGLFGFRPTIESYPNDGIINLSKTRDTHGLITRKMEDVAYLNTILLMSTAAVEPPNANTLRLGFPLSYYRENMSPQVAVVLDASVTKLKNAGVHIIEEDIAHIREVNAAVSFPVVFYETKQAISTLLKNLPNPISESVFIEKIGSPDVKALMELTFGEEGTPKEVYEDAVNKHRKQLLKTIKGYFETNQLDALLFPLTLVEATGIEENQEGNISLNGQKVPSFATYINNTDPGSNANMPGVTIPMGKTPSGLPLGLGIDALSGNDDKLLAIAQTITSILQP